MINCKTSGNLTLQYRKLEIVIEINLQFMIFK